MAPFSCIYVGTNTSATSACDSTGGCQVCTATCNRWNADSTSILSIATLEPEPNEIKYDEEKLTYPSLIRVIGRPQSQRVNQKIAFMMNITRIQ